MKKIVVLGGNGFIGRNIVEQLKDKYELYSPNRKELNLLDTKSVETFFETHQIDVVIHSAVNILSLEENTQMYFNISRCHLLYKKLITIGSGAEYDMLHYYPMMHEEYFGEYIPADTYGLSKFIASYDIENIQTNAVNLRVLGIFGKYEDYTRRFISNNIAKAMCGEDITLFQNMKFDFIYVNDFIKILEIFIENTPQHKNYNICSSRPIELLELANIIYNVHGNSNTKIKVAKDGTKPEYSADNSRFLSEFGNFKFTNYQTAISELYEYYQTVDLNVYCKQLKENL